jgi:heme/copper-type cytochrome/quinol oxidase subunit 2
LSSGAPSSADCTSKTTASVHSHARSNGSSQHHVCVELVAAIILVLVVLVPAIVVLAMFVWAARKDGQADRAVQARLGIRRRTRLGR